jgi:hypothetical protein
MLKSMIDSAETNLDQIESAYLKLNFLVCGLKASLEVLTQSDAKDVFGDVDSLTDFFF